MKWKQNSQRKGAPNIKRQSTAKAFNIGESRGHRFSQINIDVGFQVNLECAISVTFWTLDDSWGCALLLMFIIYFHCFFMRLYLHSLAKSSQPQAKCTVVESKARQSTGETPFNYFRVALVVVNSQLGGKCVARWILMPGHTGDQGVDSVDPQKMWDRNPQFDLSSIVK